MGAIRISRNCLLSVGFDWMRYAWGIRLNWNYAPSFGVTVCEGDSWFLNERGWYWRRKFK